MSTTKVYYIVPDDGDDETHPNLFTIPLSQTAIKLRDVKQHFPLRHHAYHFRFKKAFQNKFVWLDCIDENAGVPAYEGVLFCKCARLDSQPQPPAPQASSKATATAAAPVTKAAAVSSATAAPAKQLPANAAPNVPFVAAFEHSEDLFEWTDMSGSSGGAAPATASSAPSSKSAPTASASAAGGEDLLDFLGSAAGAPSASPPPVVAGMEDFEWGFPPSAPAPASTAAPQPMGGFPGVAPARTITPPTNGQQANNKPSASRIPTTLGAEAAKQFSL